MLIPAVFAAARDVLSRPLRAILFRSLGLTILLLLAAWSALTYLIDRLIAAYPVGAEHPMIGGVAVFLAGAGLLVGLAYVLPAVSALVASFFLDDVAEIVERRAYPGDPPGRALSLGRSLLTGLRFSGLSLGVNLLALTLILVPGVNVVAFFAANTYLIGREYFELAAARFSDPETAGQLRRRHNATVMTGGAVAAGLLLVPLLNLATPIFGVALMVHLHKRIAADRPRLERNVI